MHKEEMIINRNYIDINPRLTGHEDCDPGHSYGPAVREYYLMHYVVKGKGIFRTEGREYALRQGYIFMTAPGQVMYYEADKKEPWSYIWVGFDSKLGLETVFDRHIVFAPECADLFAELQGCSQFGENAELFVCGKIFELMARLQKSRTESTGQRYCLLAKNFIETRYDKDLSVGSIAALLGLDRSYFSKLFKNEVGMSPQQYLVRFRLQKAAELMRGRHISPAQAASLCGYTDLFNFSKMFKKQYGEAPRYYYNRYK